MLNFFYLISLGLLSLVVYDKGWKHGYEEAKQELLKTPDVYSDED